MAIEIASSFERKAGVPIDDKETVADITARDAIPDLVRYIGLKVTVLDDGAGKQKMFWLVGGTTDADWEEFSSGSGGGILSVADITARNAIDPADRTEGMIVYVVSEQENFQLIGGVLDANWQTLAAKGISTVTPTAFGTIAIDLTRDRQRIRLTPASAVSVNVVPFGTSAPIDGAEIILIGTSDDNTVTLTENDAAKGIVKYGKTLGRGDTATYIYSATDDRYYYLATSN